MTTPGLGVREEAGVSGVHWLILSGELDIATAPGLEARITEMCDNGTRAVVLDLSKLTFMDSTGLQAVLGATKQCAHHGLDFSLTGATGARALGIEDGQRGVRTGGLTPNLLFERLTGVRPIEDLGDLVEALADSYEDGRRAAADTRLHAKHVNSS
jgi:anti-anti-sigma factor